MAQAKGVLPRDEDREVLYRNPRTCGYLIWARLRPDLDRAGARAWFETISPYVDELVARDEAGDKVAAVAVGLAPTFFTRGGAPRFDPPIEPPAAFRPDPASPMPNTTAPLANAALVDAEVLFYVAATLESRVSRFVERLWGTRDSVQAVFLERGYQRDDDREAFGYLDGLRNVVPATERSETVFVHRDEREIEEPAWADVGTYVAYAKIAQNHDGFDALPPEAQDRVIGRTRAGERLDLPEQKVSARKELGEVGDALPLNSHVRKAGPRGARDDCQIFRRGLPFVETSSDGHVRLGLQFCSFQASLDQFDVVMNDWMTNARFPTETSGVDALLDPAAALTTFERVGFYFVPPHDDDFQAAALFKTRKQQRPKTGRLVIRKRVVDPTDPTRRFDRRGFVFAIRDASGAEIEQAATDSTGRAVVRAKLQIGATYTAEEVGIPLPNIGATTQTVTIERSHQELRIVNQVTVPNTPYGG